MAYPPRLSRAFARLRQPDGLRSPSARCAKLARWSSLAFGSLRETCPMVFARLQSFAGAHASLGFASLRVGRLSSASLRRVVYGRIMFDYAAHGLNPPSARPEISG